MKLQKLIEIENELIRTHSKLKDSIRKAHGNDTKSERYGNGWVDAAIPKHERECTNTKEASAFKRSALDLKSILSNL